MPMDASQLREFATGYTTAWCSQDPSRVATFFSPTGSISANGAPPAVGRLAITEFARGFMHTFPDLRVILDDLLIEGGHVVYHWTLIGTNTSSGGTGHRVHLSGFEKWTLGTDRLIAKSLGHFDENAYRHQLQHGCDG
jgi:hypothetical protein